MPIAGYVTEELASWDESDCN